MSKTSLQASSRLKIFKACAVILAIAATSATSAAFITSIKQDGFYLSSSPATTAMMIALALPVVAAISALFLFNGKRIVCESRGTVVIAVSKVLPAAGAICATITRIGAIVSRGSLATFDIIQFFLAFFVIIYALTGIFKFSTSIELFSGYAQIAFSMFLVAEIYLDNSVAMNGPLKSLVQLALVSVALDTLSDIRIIIGRSRANMFVFTKLLATALPPSAFAAAMIGTMSAPDNYSAAYLSSALFAVSYAIFAAVNFLKASTEAAASAKDQDSEFGSTSNEETDVPDTSQEGK